jgi:hypothetical protein
MNYNVLLIEFKSHVELNSIPRVILIIQQRKNKYKDQKEIINRDFVIIFSGL